MNTLEFRATECGRKTQNGTIICGASNSKVDRNRHTFIFMRSSRRDDPDDWGPYFELDDQSWGGYKLVAECRTSPGRLAISLRRSDQNPIPYGEVVVDLTRCAKKDVDAFMTGLRRIFFDQRELIVSAAQQRDEADRARRKR
jgi:hypothetical protein